MGTPLQVLLVEDSEDDALLTLNQLRGNGFDPVWERVETAGAMRAALGKNTWDIIISDMQMPQFDGLKALTIRNEDWPGVPFILVSGTIGEDVAVSTMKRGANDYLLKGHLKRLATAVERELRDAVERRERKRAEDTLRQFDKLDAIGRLAGGMAHDFNNHLGIIIGYSERLLERLGANDPLRKNAGMIKEAALRAASLTRQLLAFSRRQVFEARVLDLNAIVSELSKMLRPLIGEAIELVTSLNPAPSSRMKKIFSPFSLIMEPTSIEARGCFPVYFQAFPSRFSSAIRRSPRSPWATRGLVIVNSTSRSGVVLRSPSAIPSAIAPRSTGTGRISALATRARPSKSSMSSDIRFVAASILAR